MASVAYLGRDGEPTVTRTTETVRISDAWVYIPEHDLLLPKERVVRVSPGRSEITPLSLPINGGDA